jgi:cation diffusion facilitator family transporter
MVKTRFAEPSSSVAARHTLENPAMVHHPPSVTPSRLETTPETASAIAAAAAGVLAVSKIMLYWYTGSLIVAVSAVDSAMDVVVSLLNRKALIFARQRPDEDHPYGHGKAESMAALGQGALLIGASLAIVGSAVENLYRLVKAGAAEPQSSWFTVLFFLGAALVSVGITLWLRLSARRHHSPALIGDAAHYQSDVYTNVGSAAGLTAIYLTGINALDPIIAAAFACKIAWSGLGLIRTSVDELMDHDVSPELKETVESHARQICPQLIDIHKFRGRRSGHRYLFDFHVSLPSKLSFVEVHEIVEAIEEGITERFNADTVIHADPL